MPRRGIEGVVVDTASHGVPGARVDIVRGPAAGTSVIADGNGHFALPGRFVAGAEITVRASKEGYFETSETIEMPPGGSSRWARLMMRSMAPPADLAGRYLVTLTAADECRASLPAALRSRTYSASIVRGQTQEQFSGTLLVPPDRNTMFAAAVAGSSVTLWFGDLEFNVPGVVDDPGTGTLFIAGDAAALASPGQISGALRGDWIYCPQESAGRSLNDPWGCPRSAAQGCHSRSHQIVLSAR